MKILTAKQVAVLEAARRLVNLTTSAEYYPRAVEWDAKRALEEAVRQPDEAERRTAAPVEGRNGGFAT